MSYISTKAASLRQGAIRAMFDRAQNMENVISMGIGEPDMATPALVCEAGAEALRQGFTHYTPNAGLPELRKAVAEKSDIRGMHYDPITEIIITNGGMGALSLLFQVILNEGDEVLDQDPQWLNYDAQIRYCGGVSVRVPVTAAERFEMRPETVEPLITRRTKALILNSPNNPTGEVMRRETLERIADIARRHDLLVISDEVYRTLLYTKTKYCSIAELPGMKERTVVVNSFSKSFAMTGWRIGYAAGPAEVIDRMVKCQENFNACANAPGQYAAICALEHPELSNELCQVFAKRREILMDGLFSIPGIRCNIPAGAFYAFPDIGGFGLTSAEFCNRLLEEERVVCIPGSAFGEHGEGFIRVAYTCVESQLSEALARIKRFCSRQ